MDAERLRRELKNLIDASTYMQSRSGYQSSKHQHNVSASIWSGWSRQLKTAAQALNDDTKPKQEN